MDNRTTGMPELTIAELATFPVASPAGRHRRLLAEEALADPTWVAIDARRRKAGLSVSEQRPVMPLPSVLATHGLLSSSDFVGTTHADRSVQPGWLRAGAVVGVGAVYGALLTMNTALPSWYSGWADFGPSVGWAGTGFVGMSLGALYAMGAASLPTRMRPVLDSAVGGYAAMAIHPFIGIMAWVGAAAGLLASRARERAARRLRVADDEATVRAILDAPVEPVGEYSVMWGRFTGTPAQAADLLCARALELEGHDLAGDDAWSIVDDVSSRRDPIDTAATVLAAEVWLLACDATEFEQAASIGPAALGAYAAILARATGEAAPTSPPLPGENAWPATEQPLAAKLARFRAWSESNVGVGSFAEITARAATDLAYGGGGDDRCSRAARFLYDSTH